MPIPPHRSRTRKLAIGVAAAALTLSMAAVTTAANGAPAPEPGATMSAKAAAQIAALQQIKSSLSPAERKLDSRLAVTVRQRGKAGTTSAVPKLRTGVEVAANGTTAVDISVTAVTKDLIPRLQSMGATIAYASARLSTVRASLPVANLSAVAAWPQVRHISIAAGAITARESKGGATRSDAVVTAAQKSARAQRLGTQLRAALATAADDQGAVVSEGDKTDAADKARARTGVMGTGVKVCALSDGVDSLTAAQAAGELPAVDVLDGQAGEG